MFWRRQGWTGEPQADPAPKRLLPSRNLAGHPLPLRQQGRPISPVVRRRRHVSHATSFTTCLATGVRRSSTSTQSASHITPMHQRICAWIIRSFPSFPEESLPRGAKSVRRRRMASLKMTSTVFSIFFRHATERRSSRFLKQSGARYLRSVCLSVLRDAVHRHPHTLFPLPHVDPHGLQSRTAGRGIRPSGEDGSPVWRLLLW